MRILCAVRDKIAENDKSLTCHQSIRVQIASAAEGGSTLCANGSLAIWQTCLTSGDTILTWRTLGPVAVR